VDVAAAHGFARTGQFQREVWKDLPWSFSMPAMRASFGVAGMPLARIAKRARILLPRAVSPIPHI
jgi:hypothetical protein